MSAVRALAVALLIGATAAPAAEPAVPVPPSFVRKPAVRKDGAKTVVDFELNREVDVAVYVENAAGEVVRHLAAGVLGKNAPEPLKPGTLAQSLVWDGKDDAGKQVHGGPLATAKPSGEAGFKVRVAAGLGVGYDGTAFGSEAAPNDLTNVIGLAAGPDGRVYVLSERLNWAWWKQTTIHVFRRSGEYEKTIKPFPASLSPERVGKLTPFKTDDGRPMPTIYHVIYMNFYPYQDLPCQMTVSPDGNLHQVVNRNAYHKETEKWLASLAPDGGVAYDSYAGEKLPSATFAGDPHLAAASDGQAVYATGLERLSAGEKEARPNTPAVYRIELPERKEAKLFFGDAKEAGAGETRLKDPRGLATDGKGRLYIADTGNGRVVAVDEKDGRFQFAFEVPEPRWVGVHGKTGAVYVASKGEVIKFAVGADGQAAEKARLKLPALPAKEAARVRWSFALDSSAEPAVLWVGSSRVGDALLRVEEQGGGFGDLKPAGFRPARFYWNLDNGHDGRTVSCKAGHYGLRILDERTGQTRDLRLEGSSGQTYRLGPDNQIYGMDHWKWGIRRWDKDGKPLPYPATKDHPEAGGRGRTPSHASGTTNWERDFDVDRAGNVYVKQRGKIYHGRMTVDKYDPDGKKVGTAIWVVSDGGLGPQLDAAGNLYIADIVKPVGEPIPKYFEGRLPKAWIEKDQNVEQQYRWMYGSVMKFSPAGGAIWFPKPNENFVYAFEGEAQLPPGQPRIKMETVFGDRSPIAAGELQGALWMKYGVSYILDMVPSHNRRCHCVATEFKVDPFGRVFHTDQGRFRVVVLDTNGNEILSFGQYGNQDACGADSYVVDPAGKFLRPRRKDDPGDLVSPEADPKLAFSWFTGLGVSDRWIYVADGSNRRVVRVKMTYAAEETAAAE